MACSIDHVAIYVYGLEAVKDFFMRFFGAKAGNMYYNPKTGLRSYFLTFGEGTRLEIMSRPEVSGGARGVCHAGYAHIAVSVGSEEQVDRLTGTLEADGYEIISEPRVTGDGYYESCITGPENNIIEITV